MPHSFAPLGHTMPMTAGATPFNQAAQPDAIAPELLQSIGPILLANKHSGRMARAMATGRLTTPDEYTRAVAGFYQAWQPVLHRLVCEGDEVLWAELFARLQCLGRRYLRHAAPHLIDGLEDTALACAEDTAIAIMRARYPFDCNFMAWAFATLRTFCRRRLYQLCNATDLFPYCRVDGDVNDLWAEREGDDEQQLDDLFIDVARATPRLATASRRQFARLYYYEGRSYEQIAAEMGKSINALYKLNNDTLANYRQLLNPCGRPVARGER